MNVVYIDIDNTFSIDRSRFEDRLQTNINIMGSVKNDDSGIDNTKMLKSIVVFKDDESLKAFYAKLTKYIENL